MNKLTPYQLFPLTRTEAREHTDAVKYHLNEAGRHLLIMRDSEGWRSLDYQSFTQYLECEFTECRSHLYDLMRAAPVVERLQQVGYTPNTAQALALAKVPEPLQVITYEMAAKRQGGATAQRIEAIGGTLAEALVTGGYVTTGEGTQVALENAINSVRYEQEVMKRHYFTQNAPVCITEIDEYGIVTQPIILSIDDIRRVKVGQTVRVSVWVEETT